jgi:predicted nucleotidyltransferase component of viral defense system
MRMAHYFPTQTVEIFHLLFLSLLGQKLDKQKWVLKGGCNLRFFFKSPRYSDDMDLDVKAIPVDVLNDKVEAILSGRPFKTILEVRGIHIEHVTRHKQTQTTQRWKFGLQTERFELPIPTKIKFSRRGLESGGAFEPVSPEILRAYDLPPVMANHYSAEIAWRQKIRAIFSRSAPQARDVFDLHLMLVLGLKELNNPIEEKASYLERAKENILDMEFAVFKSQVVSFLEPALQLQYDSEDVWDAMRWRVIRALEGAPS